MRERWEAEEGRETGDRWLASEMGVAQMMKCFWIRAGSAERRSVGRRRSPTFAIFRLRARFDARDRPTTRERARWPGPSVLFLEDAALNTSTYNTARQGKQPQEQLRLPEGHKAVVLGRSFRPRALLKVSLREWKTLSAHRTRNIHLRLSRNSIRRLALHPRVFRDEPFLSV